MFKTNESSYEMIVQSPDVGDGYHPVVFLSDVGESVEVEWDTDGEL